MFISFQATSTVAAGGGITRGEPTISILSISWFHLYGMMHLEHGQGE